MKPADGENAVINQPLVVDGKSYNVTCVSMGNPHAIVYLDNDIDIKKFELEKSDRVLKNMKHFQSR